MWNEGDKYTNTKIESIESMRLRVKSDSNNIPVLAKAKINNTINNSM